MDASLHRQFAEIEWGHWWFCARRSIIADVLSRRICGVPSAPRHFLDIGCGAGAMIDVLKDFGTVSGVDASSESIDYCRRRFPTVAFSVGGIPEVLTVFAPVDVACAFDVIEHLDDPIGALRAARSAMKPGGLLVCTVPAYQWLWGPHDDLNGHRRRYTSRLLRYELEQAGFRVERITYFNALLLPIIAGTRLVRRHLLHRQKPASDFVMPSRLVNALLMKVMASERFLLRRVSLPCGVSLLALASPRPTG